MIIETIQTTPTDWILGIFLYPWIMWILWFITAFSPMIIYYACYEFYLNFTKKWKILKKQIEIEQKRILKEREIERKKDENDYKKIRYKKVYSDDEINRMQKYSEIIDTKPVWWGFWSSPYILVSYRYKKNG